VPDNQEVFTDVNTDQSIIIELLSMEEASNEESALHHFKEIARDNDALSEYSVLKIERLGKDDMPNFGYATLGTRSNKLLTRHVIFNSDDVFKSVLVGQQRIAKFNERAKNTVTIFLAVVRLANVTTDVIVTLNDPSQISPDSSSAESVSPSSLRPTFENTLAVLKVLLKSFDVKDWNLFAAE